MFFRESEQLAKDNPESKALLTSLDSFLQSSEESTLLLVRRVASKIGSSRTQTAALLELFAESKLLVGQVLIECECGVFAEISSSDEACTSCGEEIRNLDTVRAYRFSESAKAKLGAAAAELPAPQATTPKLSEGDMKALRLSYSGIWGSKVIWLAAFTFAPLLIGLKVPGLRIHFGIATLIYASYHALGAMNWLRLRQLTQDPDAFSEQQQESLWQNISQRHRIATPLSYIVLTLLVLTVIAKIDIEIGDSSRSICLPQPLYSLIALPPPPSCR